MPSSLEILGVSGFYEVLAEAKNAFWRSSSPQCFVAQSLYEVLEDCTPPKKNKVRSEIRRRAPRGFSK